MTTKNSKFEKAASSAATKSNTTHGAAAKAEMRQMEREAAQQKRPAPKRTSK
jgi:hypothetical protein